jgi:integrase
MPTVNNLTDNQCRQVKPGEKAQKLFDGHGLHLFVSPKGAKVWRVAYRVGGKPQTATLGPYPLISLADARIKRDEIRRKLADGISPKAPKPRPGVPTLQGAADAYWSGRLDITDAYRMNALNGITQHLGPRLGAMPINEVTRQDLLDALLEMDKAGLLVYVRTVRGWVSQVFDWSVELGHCDANPASAIKTQKAFRVPAKESHAALSPPEVKPFLDRLKIEDQLLSVLACKLLALTWVRTVELRTMLWSEIEGKGDAQVWRIPAGKMKRRNEHLVPLSRQAVALLGILRQRARGSEYVFPAEHTIKRPMSENAVLYLLHRMGYKGIITGHGWRSVASTWANEAGWLPDAIERQLAHMPDDKIRAAYNRAAYLPQRREMLQAWADWLESQGMVTA